jgi:hypothetical protein
MATRSVTGAGTGLVVVGQDTSANSVPFNGEDDWLHLVLGIGMIALGLLTSRGRRSVTPAAGRDVVPMWIWRVRRIRGGELLGQARTTSR